MGVFEAVVDEAVDRCLISEYAKMLRDIVSRKQLEVFRPANYGDPPARLENMIAWLQREARVVRAKPQSDRTRLPWTAAILPRPPASGDDDHCSAGQGGIGGRDENLWGRACSINQIGVRRTR